MNNLEIIQNIRSIVRPWEVYSLVLKIPIHDMKWVDVGKCPFCKTEDKFRVNSTSGAYKCAACKVSGEDILDFIMAKKKINFIEAMRFLFNQREITLYKQVEDQLEYDY